MALHSSYSTSFFEIVFIEGNMADHIILDDLFKMAARAGLKLAEDELQKLLPGVNRARKQAAELRQLITDCAEPASTFSAQKTEKA